VLSFRRSPALVQRDPGVTPPLGLQTVASPSGVFYNLAQISDHTTASGLQNCLPSVVQQGGVVWNHVAAGRLGLTVSALQKEYGFGDLGVDGHGEASEPHGLSAEVLVVSVKHPNAALDGAGHVLSCDGCT